MDSSALSMKSLAAVSLLSLCGAVGAAAVLPVEIGDTGVAMLVEALRESYPDVSRWQIREIMGAMDATRPIEVHDISVATIGGRSALVERGHDGNGVPVRRRRWFMVQGFGVVFVSRDHIARFGDLSESHLDTKEADLLRAACAPLRDLKDLEAQRMTRSVRPGQIICRSDLEPRPAVSRGERVVVQYHRGQVSLRSIARAEEDGRLGDVIKVRNTDSRGSYLARVVGDREVVPND